MEIMTLNIELIIDKLSRGVSFGLYDNGNACYFADGTRVNYHDLWAAIRILNKLGNGHKKTLFELYPDNFLGTFPYKYSNYRLTKRILGMIFGVV